MKYKYRAFCVALLLIVLIISFASCGDKTSADGKAVAEYLQWFEYPENLPIYSIEKAEFKDEVFYYISRGPYDSLDPETVDLIVVYYPSQKTYKTRFWLDMEYGLNTEVKEQWEKRESTAKSIHVFTKEEIEAVRNEAIEYCKSKQ